MIEISARVETDSVVKPKTYLKGEGPGENIIGPLGLSPGNYALRFGKHTREPKALRIMEQMAVRFDVVEHQRTC